MVRAAGTSFYRGMRVLPADRRNAMYAIYAFCRIVDDIADEQGVDPKVRRRDLDGRALYATISLGISLFPDDGDCVEDLLRAADRQLYANKRRAGRADLEEVAATEPIARKRGRNDIN